MGHANETLPDHKLYYKLDFFLGIYVFDVSPYIWKWSKITSRIMCGKYQ